VVCLGVRVAGAGEEEAVERGEIAGTGSGGSGEPSMVSGKEEGVDGPRGPQSLGCVRCVRRILISPH
jgi:hypothetical protein